MIIVKALYLNHTQTINHMKSKQSFRTWLARYFWPRKNWWGVRQAPASDWAVYSFFAVMIAWSWINGPVLAQGLDMDPADLRWNGLLWVWAGWILLYLACFIYFRRWPLRWEEMTDEMKIIYVRYNGTGKLTHEQQMEYQAILEDRLNSGMYQ